MGIYPLPGENDAQLAYPFLRRMRWGAITFLFATPVLAFIACPSFIGSGCHGGDENVAIAAALILELAMLVMLFAGRRMWRFTIGFVVALLVSATFTRGAAAILWAAPVNLGLKATRPLWAPAVAHRKASAAKEEWLGIKRTQHPAIVHGARLVNLVQECTRRSMLADSVNSFPRSAADIVSQSGCGQLRESELENDSVSTRYSETDNGWRWQYVPGPLDAYGRAMTYAIEAKEDPAIERPQPLAFTSDEKGAIAERTSGRPPRLVASPVASLVMLRKCLTRVPAANAALRASSPWRGNSSPMNSVASVCPELTRHIGTDLPDRDDNRGRLALPTHEQAGEFTDTVAVYVTQFIPADVDGTIFELRAWPTRVQNPAVRGGVRQFFVARDGSIHARVGEEPATESDPIAAECLPGGGVDCTGPQ